jgi:uncharacterized membrane protein YhaH (DUF805 family)
MMTFAQAVNSCFRNYWNFEGRAPRAEYWWWTLFNLLASWLAAFLDLVTAGPDGFLFGFGVGLFLLVPYVSVATRRLHDVGRSGWWQLLPLTIIGIIPYVYWCCRAGNNEPNQYGSPV